jgi:6-pyruvoyl-tetrahydropterin synthase
MVYRIRRSVDISFSHHVRGHLGPCINLHGHTWKFEVGVEAKALDLQGFVVDFGRLKNEVLNPCHRLLDHALAVGAETYAAIEADLVSLGARLIASRTEVHGASGTAPSSPEPFAFAGAENHSPGGMRVAVFLFSPTSERLAEWLYRAAAEVLDDERVKVAYGRVYETLHPVESVAEFWP